MGGDNKRAGLCAGVVEVINSLLNLSGTSKIADKETAPSRREGGGGGCIVEGVPWTHLFPFCRSLTPYKPGISRRRRHKFKQVFPTSREQIRFKMSPPLLNPIG